jgi:hypothetical protein
MRQALRLHPDSRCEAITGIEIEAWRTQRAGSLVLRYVATGRISSLYLPPHKGWTRADELWKSTCFEAFVQAPPSDTYYEFNFSPSMQWAAYRFAGYRADMIVADEITPRIESTRSNEEFEVRAYLNLEEAPAWPSDALWRVGISAVIEETNGRKSYWALAHPPGKADFHHCDCFALELPGASKS